MKLKRTPEALAALICATALAGSASFAASKPPVPLGSKPASIAGTPTRPADPDQRQALFGDMHVHTTYSIDAWTKYEARVTPDDAYRFARGQPVQYYGRSVQRSEPLDFMAVTDHSEYLGFYNELDQPRSKLSLSEFGRKFWANPAAAFSAAMKLFLGTGKDKPGEVDPNGPLQSAWSDTIGAANRNYQPGRFTTFIGYEWSTYSLGLYNLHRNVIFNADTAPLPFSAFNSTNPEDLWTYLENTRARGIPALAIPHNSNASGGLMFDWLKVDGSPIDADYARRRALNEPLMEVFQIKGQSETMPRLSAADEFADFEVMDRLLTRAEPSRPEGSYGRDALGRGIELQSRTGVNPFKFGFVGGSDVHNGLSTSAENAISGSGSGIDPRTSLPGKALAEVMLKAPGADRARAARESVKGDPPLADFLVTSGGLTGVWAEQNTRSSIFAALARREVFATSGTRLKVRFFGGWRFRPALLRQPNWLKHAYDEGVPMGSDLSAAPRNNARPTFIVVADRDPNGANLDRVQVVKVWLEGGVRRERIFDVVWSGNRKRDRTGRIKAVGSTVNAQTASYSNSIGAPILRTVWSDPTFNPKLPAVYYLRAIEIPTPRWTTILAAKYRLPAHPDAPQAIQERALSSPIWYNPNVHAPLPDR